MAQSLTRPGRQARCVQGLAAYLAYWSVSAFLLCASFLGSAIPLGPGTASVRYLVGIVYAVAGVLPLVANRSGTGRAIAGIAVSGLCLLSCLSLARNDFAADKAHLPAVQYGNAIVARLKRLGLRRGYAQYWKAAALTWRSTGQIVIAPVTACTADRHQLCPYELNSISSWYRPDGSARSFLLVDPNADGFGSAVASLGRPLAVERFGPIQLRVYSYDASQRLGTRPARTRFNTVAQAIGANVAAQPPGRFLPPGRQDALADDRAD